MWVPQPHAVCSWILPYSSVITSHKSQACQTSFKCKHPGKSNWLYFCAVSGSWLCDLWRGISWSCSASYCWPFVGGIHRSPVDSPPKGPVIQKTWQSFLCWTYEEESFVNTEACFPWNMRGWGWRWMWERSDLLSKWINCVEQSYQWYGVEYCFTFLQVIIISSSWIIDKTPFFWFCRFEDKFGNQKQGKFFPRSDDMRWYGLLKQRPGYSCSGVGSRHIWWICQNNDVWVGGGVWYQWGLVNHWMDCQVLAVLHWSSLNFLFLSYTLSPMLLAAHTLLIISVTSQ